ncbi:uncharacterized protein LOC116666442 isoform X4 [Camelus ferus]|uniref:Uncharacterized protein LOC116666442 isoform X4 n=1 Tax=Camelus ferus TaxID=419612 RepID=A0A8B8TRL2_CAMFR|nr:uncharacterized protein LOC116666442 isoform X4 [Camelus ferus]
MDTALSTKPERSVYSEVTQRSLALPLSSSLKHEGYCSPLDFCLCSLDGLGQAGCEGLGAVVSRRQMILNEEYKRLDFLTVPGDGSGRKSRPPPPCKLGNSLAESVVLPGKWTLQEVCQRTKLRLPSRSVLLFPLHRPAALAFSLPD